MIQQNLARLRTRLLDWYGAHRRPLPWRENPDAYRIWLSEMILQQTRVAQGLPYYQRFTEQFPAIADLAAATEEEVLKLWQGLGYYSRARYLHAAARTVAQAHGGRFPQTYEAVRALKGVGDYSAAAIVSTAFNLPYAALDGNVYRVLSRLKGIELEINAPGAKKLYSEAAQELLDKDRPGDFNQAMMELGATICTPKSPDCPACPLMQECVALQTGRTADLPRKLAARPVQNRYFHYYLLRTPDGIWLRRRGPGDIWQGLYDLPIIENDAADVLPGDAATGIWGAAIGQARPVRQMMHKLTHRSLHLTFYIAEARPEWKPEEEGYVFAAYARIGDFPVPKPVELFLKKDLSNQDFC